MEFKDGDIVWAVAPDMPKALRPPVKGRLQRLTLAIPRTATDVYSLEVEPGEYEAFHETDLFSTEAEAMVRWKEYAKLTIKQINDELTKTLYGIYEIMKRIEEKAEEI